METSTSPDAIVTVTDTVIMTNTVTQGGTITQTTNITENVPFGSFWIIGLVTYVLVRSSIRRKSN